MLIAVSYKIWLYYTMNFQIRLIILGGLKESGKRALLKRKVSDGREELKNRLSKTMKLDAVASSSSDDDMGKNEAKLAELR